MRPSAMMATGGEEHMEAACHLLAGRPKGN